MKSHPATFGYVSVKEPSWSRINASEIRAMYRAFKAADPAKPVIALFAHHPPYRPPPHPNPHAQGNLIF